MTRLNTDLLIDDIDREDIVHQFRADDIRGDVNHRFYRYLTSWQSHRQTAINEFMQRHGLSAFSGEWLLKTENETRAYIMQTFTSNRVSEDNVDELFKSYYDSVVNNSNRARARKAHREIIKSARMKRKFQYNRKQQRREEIDIKTDQLKHLKTVKNFLNFSFDDHPPIITLLALRGRGL